jgi:hypothetical protein
MTLRAMPALLCWTAAASAATLTGRVADAAGNPIEHATVMVYHAGLKMGYSTFCPSCYADCGKRTVTDSSGRYTITGLSPDLNFELLVVRDGYRLQIVKDVQPLATLDPRPSGAPDRTVRGRVINQHGLPVADALITPRGLTAIVNGTPAGIGVPRSMEPMAVTNARGEFEIAHSEPVVSMTLLVEPRGMATRIFQDVAAGAERRTLTVTDGAIVRGRLVRGGKPVGGAEIGLVSQRRADGLGFDEIRIGTNTDGTFVITNVPAPEKWYAYAKSESLTRPGATGAAAIETMRDGQDVDLGDLPVQPGHRLTGAIVLAGSKRIPRGMSITVGRACMVCRPGYQPFSVKDSRIVQLGADGKFAVPGLLGPIAVTVAVKGYALSADPAMLWPADDDPEMRRALGGNRQTLRAMNTTEILVDRDVRNFVIYLTPVGH